MSDSRFHLLDPDRPTPERRAAVRERILPPGMRSLRESAAWYRPTQELVDAVNVALAVGAPLLLTGEPGTGKTQVAHYLAWYFALELLELHVRSTTTADDLFYHFDAVEYLHAAHDPERRPDLAAVKQRILDAGKGPLWNAYDKEGHAVVLMDEIDKAARDFPNDLLHAIDQHEFTVKETGETIRSPGTPPIIVITSNSERRLPPPFLRRCIVHHIELTDELLRRAVAAHARDHEGLDDDAREAAFERFFELRSRDLRKKPATAELLTWLAVLAARGDVTARNLRGSPLMKLPALVALVKDHDDYALLR